ncbi:sigma factor-like helix-turn-helix DNA-binding protein [Bacillus sp. MUM 13]|uniref:sigma factor-like helix-turn-helix DNA-binding protein n=1 Tax=Bacillus sp. MUM 13 TaxID=1678001 RepID=UPI001F0A7264|nr:sigma factor-like helix-turn-helix DNA-binding protein [Bacillus sp. MUM 13]
MPSGERIYIFLKVCKASGFDSRFTPASDDLLNEVSAVFHDRPLEEEILLTYCESLTAKQAAWVLLSFKDNLTIQEIAKGTGYSASAVKSWKKSALNVIKADILSFIIRILLVRPD